MSKPKRRAVEESAADNLKREDLPPCRYYLSTGSTLLDLDISGRYPGGVGSGRITHMYGDNSTAKSVLCTEILGSAQRQKGSAIYEDAELTLDFGRAEDLFGLRVGPWRCDDPEQIAEWIKETMPEGVAHFPEFTYRIPLTVAKLYDDEVNPALKMIHTGILPSPCAMGVDTFSAIPSQEEAKEKLDKGTYGTSRAKMYSKAFRKYIRPIAEADLTIVAVDQTRTKIDAGQWEKKHVTSGGKAMFFYASTRIFLKHTAKVFNEFGRAKGVRIDYDIEKNKIAPPFGRGFLYVLFDYGVDNVRANLEWLKNMGKSQEDKKGKTIRPAIPNKVSLNASWWKFEGASLGQGIEPAIKAIEKEGWETDLEHEVVRVWTIMNPKPDRKPKHRGT